jgi:hypothetical protein
MSKPADDVEPYPDWARQDEGPRLLAVIGTMTTLGFLFVVARIYSRRIKPKPLAIDDYILVVSTMSVTFILALIGA